jgi:GntR family transcriptional regulator
MRIERGELTPGTSLPTLAELSQQWSTSLNSARGAIALLKAQGLITAGRGKAPIVRIPPGRVIRSSERHQIEKDLATKPEHVRRGIGEAETNHNMSIDQQQFDARYDQIPAGEELAQVFDISATDTVLRRVYEATDGVSGRLLSWSVSYVPLQLIRDNPDLLDAANEPWPGGTQHQLSTVGIEVMTVIDQVIARMPTTAEARSWDLPDGVPLLICRRISCDRDNRTVEVSDADYPADRTELHFMTPLKAWPRSRSTARHRAK